MDYRVVNHFVNPGKSAATGELSGPELPSTKMPGKDPLDFPMQQLVGLRLDDGGDSALKIPNPSLTPVLMTRACTCASP